MKTLLLASCIIAFAAALPAEDVVVPEQALFEAVDADFEAARVELQQLRAKKTSDKDCRELADATENDVKASVKAQQNALDSIDKGEKCPTRHAQAVHSSKKILDKAKADKKKADDIYAKAKKTRIKFDIPYDQMTPGQCSLFFNKPAYKKVHTSAKQAKYKAGIAKGSLTTAQKAYDAAVRDQKKAINKCQCDVKKLQNATLVKMNSAVKAANEKLYKKAANLRCLLDGTPASKCKVGSIPVVVPVKVTAATAAATCGPRGRVVFDQFSGNAMGCRGTKAGCVRKGGGGGNDWNAGARSKMWIGYPDRNHGSGMDVVYGGYGFCATRGNKYVKDWTESMIGVSNTGSYTPYDKLTWGMYAGSSGRFGIYNHGHSKFVIGAPRGWKFGLQACLYTTQEKISFWLNNDSRGWRKVFSSPTTLQGQKNWLTPAPHGWIIGAAMSSPNSQFSDIYWISEEPRKGSKGKAPMA